MEQATPPICTIEQLYAVYHQPLVRYLKRLVSDSETAEDLAQETFIKALLHWNELASVAATRSWLYRIATNTAYDHLRRRRRIAMLPLLDDHEAIVSPVALETEFEDAEQVWAALSQVPEHYRIPLILQSWAGYNLNDIAAAIGTNVATVKSRVHRGRARFRQLYVT